MRRVVVTGADGFIGRNLTVALRRLAGVEVLTCEAGDPPGALEALLEVADFVFHLAGVNRPVREEEFFEGNRDLTLALTAALGRLGRRTPLLISSSTQAALPNPYGESKRQAEEAVFRYGRECTAPVYVYRLTNVFGKWCRPNYNSAVATFCHNIARGLEVTVSDPQRELELVYVDDVVRSFVDSFLAGGGAEGHLAVSPSYRVTLGELVERVRRLRRVRETLLLPDLSDRFTRCLYATYLSYLATDDLSYRPECKSDGRGALAELIKSEHFGQIFVSRTRPGVTRGNHWHDTKVEKFCVLQGEGVIRLRHLFSDEVLCYPVSGERPVLVDIPPGYTHSIENGSDCDMIVLFWASQLFDPEAPDTYSCEVHRG